MILFVLYLCSVAISGYLLWNVYLESRKSYKFSWPEKILGLVVIPLIPVVNLILAFIQHQSKSI